MDPANALATLLNRELGTDIKPDDMRSFIVLNWPSVTTFAHAIHDQGASAGPATAPVVPDQVVNKIKAAEVGHAGVKIVLENGGIYRCRPAAIDTTAMHEWGECVIADDRLSVAWPNVGVNIEVPQIDLHPAYAAKQNEEALDLARNERVTALHGIKTLAIVKDLYADLRHLQRLHAAVQKGAHTLVLRATHHNAEMHFIDGVAMQRALTELRERISGCRAGLIQLGFDPDASDPNDDEG